MARVVETVDETVCWDGGVSATSDVLGRFWTWDSHSLIEDKTFALPMGCSDFLVVVNDATVQLVHLSKALASEEGGGFFATDTSGAIHENFAVFERGESVHVRREFPKVLDIAFDRVCELSHSGFVAVSDIDENDCWIGLDGVTPLFRAEVVVMGIRLKRSGRL